MALTWAHLPVWTPITVTSAVFVFGVWRGNFDAGSCIMITGSYAWLPMLSGEFIVAHRQASWCAFLLYMWRNDYAAYMVRSDVLGMPGDLVRCCAMCWLTLRAPLITSAGALFCCLWGGLWWLWSNIDFGHTAQYVTQSGVAGPDGVYYTYSVLSGRVLGQFAVLMSEHNGVCPVGWQAWAYVAALHYLHGLPLASWVSVHTQHRMLAKWHALVCRYIAMASAGLMVIVSDYSPWLWCASLLSAPAFTRAGRMPRLWFAYSYRGGHSFVDASLRPRNSGARVLWRHVHF